MDDQKSLLANIEASPEGPSTAAFFDFDGTLIAGYSAMDFLREQYRGGHIDRKGIAEVAGAMMGFVRGKLGFSGLMVASARIMTGIREDEYIKLGEEMYKKQIAKRVYPESRALVDAHLKKGHTVAIISSATPYQVTPTARDMKIDNVLCSHLEVREGVFTGDIVRPLCFGEGKVTAAKKMAETTGVNLKESFFYSDSTDDLQLLECVRHPVALNPSDDLRSIAEKRDWPIATFASRGRKTPGAYVRAAAAMGSLVVTSVAGMPIKALTGSPREAQNFSYSLFGDVASALIKLDVKIKGEEFLWQKRPAVFVFNHQSKADVIVLAKILRRDVAGIGKKELGEIPVIGRILKNSGMVFVDRANSVSAIEAMRPLVDAVKRERKSVVLAPEGTRSTSRRLGPFKKGAFHLAMQTGVPIVPIVIHNAGDVAPKGEFVFWPGTVEVEVLPPVDTSKWKPETVAQHAAEVRSMFLSALDQVDDTETEGSNDKEALKSMDDATKKPGSKRNRRPADLPSSSRGANQGAKQRNPKTSTD